MTERKEFVITHEIDAPRDLVWKALTEPDRLAEWWGPKGFKWIGCTLELKPGGAFHYGMASPGGLEIWGKWTYGEIVPPKKLVFINGFADAAGNLVRAHFSETWPIEIHNTWTLEEHGGKTTLTMRSYPVNATEAELANFEGAREHLERGFAGTFDQLAAYLARP